MKALVSLSSRSKLVATIVCLPIVVISIVRTFQTSLVEFFPNEQMQQNATKENFEENPYNNLMSATNPLTLHATDDFGEKDYNNLTNASKKLSIDQLLVNFLPNEPMPQNTTKENFEGKAYNNLRDATNPLTQNKTDDFGEKAYNNLTNANKLSMDEPLQQNATIEFEKKANDNSPYAYAFVIWNINPEDPETYGRQLANTLIAAKNLRMYASRADVVFLIEINSERYNSSKLPDKYEAICRFYNVKLRYVSMKSSGTMMSKFHIYNLTEYRRINFLDNDVMPLSNLDYLMELSDAEVIEPTVVISTRMEPANGGFFIIEPSSDDYQAILKYMQHQRSNHKTAREFNKEKGWGHIIKPPDQWETSSGKNGTLWNFMAAHDDQGFLYHYPKYVKKRLTSITGKKVITHREINGTIGIAREIFVNSPRDSPFFNYSKPFFGKYKNTHIKSHCGKRCLRVPPYRDFEHFTGMRKPYRSPASMDFLKHKHKEQVISGYHLWWNTLRMILVEVESMTLQDFGTSFCCCENVSSSNLAFGLSLKKLSCL